MKRNLEELVNQMTAEEKAGLCSGLDFWHLKGVARLGIPSIMVTDGPHGLRKQAQGADHLGLMDSVPATCFPSAAGLASSWDRELIYSVGAALGEECQAENVAILLGPGVNIKRSPLNGRNFEYFSEDPYLSSELAASHIQGVQSQGVGTSLKHFAVNNQEHRRMTTDAIVDERTLREIYLASFEGAVQQGKPWTVMSSYNKVNGTYASENARLLTDILKDEWNHEGFVVSDWGAVNERADALAAGLELEMPASGGLGEKKVLEALASGKLSVEALDRAVLRLLRIIFMAVDQKKEDASYDKDGHHALARRVAAESMVLLKNEDRALPLRGGKLAVIGAFAETPRFQGGGSSHIVPTRVDSPLEELRKLRGGEGGGIAYAPGYSIGKDAPDAGLAAEAKRIAGDADTAVLFVGLPDRYESEGYDRSHMNLPDNQLQLIQEIAAVQNNLVVVLMSGSPVVMPWLGSVKALLQAYLGGQAAGGAIADLLLDRANPSGKLAETFPLKLSDNPSYLNFPGEGDRTEYREGVFVGYRYYDKKEMDVLFPFGHGLSYTEFEYSDLEIDRDSIRDTETAQVSVTVRNIGAAAGKEIVQLYVCDPRSKVIRPLQELKGFAKAALEPGEAKTLSFTLGKRAFAYYETAVADWHAATGDYEVRVGSSSRDIRLAGKISVESTVKLPKTYSLSTTVGDLLADPEALPVIGPLLQKMKESSGLGEAGGEQSGMGEMMQAMIAYLPLRSVLAFGGGAVTEQELLALIGKLNRS
ncbi:glycoside hydrolase family 3 C-terminal domain-containing protein [Paenibacillus sp. D51F]